MMMGGLDLDFDLDSDLDLDEDGINETALVEMDSDNDGIIDQVVILSDTDEDGSIDHFSVIIDQDGDSEVFAIEMDMDGDQVIDALGIFEYDSEDHSVDAISLEFLEDDIEGSTGGPDWPNFDPEMADSNAICGDPAASMEEWEYQGPTGRCTLYSQKFVIEELTGQDLNIEDMVEIAEEHGWFTEENGSSMLNMNRMLDYYGVSNDMSFDNTFEDIRRCLQNGGKVIVSLDSDEIWHGEQDNIFTPMDSANHAVQVIGIDETDPSNPMVILNDSGTLNGCGEMIPLDVFLDAWEDGMCQMIVSY